LDHLINNGLAEPVEGKLPRCRITSKGFEALRHFWKIEKLIPEMMMREIESQA